VGNKPETVWGIKLKLEMDSTDSAKTEEVIRNISRIETNTTNILIFKITPFLVTLRRYKKGKLMNRIPLIINFRKV